MECKNCQNRLTAESDYCNVCGAKVIRNRLTMRNLFEHFSETFLNYDNKFLQTFIGLFTRPEEVIGTYIQGTRKKYVNVVSYFAIAITLSGLQLYILNKFFPNSLDMSSLYGNAVDNTQKNDIMSNVQEYQSIIMMLYVPLYALISRIVFLNKKTYNYTEQLVIYMYIQAQISIASAVILTILVVFGLNYFSMSFPFALIMVAYAGYCLKRLYKLTILELILKTLIFGLILGALIVLIIIIVVAYMYLSGQIPDIVEAQKAARGA